MFTYLRHIARPVVTLVLALYSVSVVFCLDADCLSDDKVVADCNVLSSGLAQHNAHSDDDSHSNDNRSRTPLAASERATDHENDDDGNEHHCSCVCHTPAFVQSLVMPGAVADAHSYFTANTTAPLPLRSRFLYRPPQA